MRRDWSSNQGANNMFIYWLGGSGSFETAANWSSDSLRCTTSCSLSGLADAGLGRAR